MANMDFSALSGILAVYGIILLCSGAFGLVAYVFQSIGLYKMGKNLSLAHCWMAWVPFLSTYFLGKIGSKYEKRDGKPSAKFGGWLIALEISMLLIITGMIIAVVLLVIGVLSMENSGAEMSEAAILGKVIPLILAYLAFFAVTIAYSVVYYIALWRLFAIFDNSTATVFLIVSILFGVATPFLIFAVRNNKPCLTYNERIGYISPTVNE